MDAQQTLDVLFAVTGLSLEDFERELGAKTPADESRERVLTLRKMEAHARGVPLSAVPDFITYPDTGFPGEIR